MSTSTYKRILLKISGEALAGDQDAGLDPQMLKKVAHELIELQSSGIEVAIVIGAGNIFRGLQAAAKGSDRVTADQMGMLGTMINCLALTDQLRQLGASVALMTNVPMPEVAATFHAHTAKNLLSAGQIVICGGGTGNPFFTTDTASALKAVELECDVMLKGTNVDGVYSADPKQDPNAERFEQISYDDVIAKNLKVMDMAAFALARDNQLPILIYDMAEKGGAKAVLDGNIISTRVG